MTTTNTVSPVLPTATATDALANVTDAPSVAAEPKPRRRRLGFRTHVRAGAGKGDVC
ncbi:MAG: hypothetical protein H6711_24225 [Myxococcales bacterium]|nr:hypothetical protein [Myxococcales bacterium]